MDDGVRGKECLGIVGRLAVIAKVKQTFRAVEVRRLDALSTYTRVTPMRRVGERLRHLARAHRVAATSVSGERRRQRRHWRAVGRQARHMTAGWARDEAARFSADCVVVVGRSYTVETAVVGQTAFAERVTTIQMARRRRKRRFEAE